MAVRCRGGCDGREESAVEALLQWQKVSDFLIGASFLSIPLELLHFATCADLAPLRWVLLQFGAFIVLCGIAHLLAVFTYDRPNTRRLLVALTVAKILAALASFAAAVSLPTFIPQLLRLKVREALLRDKARRLDRDLTLVRRRDETASRVVRALTEHIRRDCLTDAHGILRAAMLHLSGALGLRRCAVWMPAADNRGVLHLVHQLPGDQQSTTARAIRISHPDVAGVVATKDAKVLRPGSPLRWTSPELQRTSEGDAAAIQIPMLLVSDFVSGSSESYAQGVVRSYAILVMVLPAPATPISHRSWQRLGGEGTGGWSRQELEIVEVVSYQVAVALSHAAVLKDWQLTRRKLAERQRAVAQARHDAAEASRARDAAQSAVRGGVLRPMHAVVGLLSVMQQQDEAPRSAEQRLAVSAMVRTSALSSTLTDDVMAALLTPQSGRGEPASSSGPVVSLTRRPFDIRMVVRDAAGVAGCLARCRGLGFAHRAAELSALPAECWAVGDDKRVFHLLLHMLGVLLDRCERHRGHLSFSVDTVVVEDDIVGDHQDRIITNCSGCSTVSLRFQFGMTRVVGDSVLPSSISSETRLSVATCNTIVQMMNGNMWWEFPSDSEGQHGTESMSLILHFQLGFGVPSPSSAPGGGLFRIGGGFGAPPPSSLCATPPQYHFNGLRVLLADTDDTSREVTRMLLERLGCHVLLVPSAAHCLCLLMGSAAADQQSFPLDLQVQMVILDLQTPAAGADAASAMDDGFELALRIRELANESFSWMLILVALPLPPRASGIDVRDVCQRAGVNGVIHKPITLPALGAQLYRVLNSEN